MSNNYPYKIQYSDENEDNERNYRYFIETLVKLIIKSNDNKNIKE